MPHPSLLQKQALLHTKLNFKLPSYQPHGQHFQILVPNSLSRQHLNMDAAHTLPCILSAGTFLIRVQSSLLCVPGRTLSIVLKIRKLLVADSRRGSRFYRSPRNIFIFLVQSPIIIPTLEEHCPLHHSLKEYGSTCFGFSWHHYIRRFVQKIPLWHWIRNGQHKKLAFIDSHCWHKEGRETKKLLVHMIGTIAGSLQQILQPFNIVICRRRTHHMHG